MSTHRASHSPQPEAASIELDFTSRASYFRTLAGHYDALTAHFPPEQILTPNTGKEKLYQTYYYHRKVLVRINPRASGPQPAEGETVFHEVYCTWCHKEPEDKFSPGRGHWRVKSGSTTTSALNEHVKSKHRAVVPRDEQDEERILREARVPADCGDSYQGLGKRSAHSAGLVIEKVPSWKHRKAGSKISKQQFRKLLLEFVISANLASSVVENPQFRALLQYLDPTVQPFFISRYTLGRDMRKVRKEMQEKVKSMLQRHIQTGGMISLTLDAWTSCSQQGYLAITGYFVEKRSRGDPSKLRSLLLAFRPLAGSHDAENKAEVVTTVTEEFGITGHIRSITADDAATNEAMCAVVARDERWGKFTVRDCFVGCFAHTLNLAAQEILRVLDGDKEAVNEDDLSCDNTIESPSRQEADQRAAVAAILHIARKIVAKVRKSTHLWEVLERFQSVQELKPVKKLVLDVCTRWNSTHHMVRRLIQLRSAVDPLCTSQPKLEKLNLVLDDFDWEWLGKLDSILSIFSKPTEVISGESYPTLSQQLPHYWKLAMQLRNLQDKFSPGAVDHNDTAYEACEAAWKKLNKYHIKTDSFTAPRIATILDPRLKLETLERQGWKPSEVRGARSVLERMLKEYYPAETSSQLDDTQAPEEPGVPDPEDLLIFGSQEAVSPAPGARSSTPLWKVELQCYLTAPKAPFSADILKWWDFHELEYPHLAKVARDYAGIPGSSVPSEHVFSRAGDLITKKRNRLAPETADSIMCLRYWLGLPEITQEERMHFEDALEDGTENEFLVDHYLPEDDDDEDMGILVEDVQE